MSAVYRISFDVGSVAIETGFPTDHELFADFERELRAVVDGLGPIGVSSIDGASRLHLVGAPETLRRACEFTVMSFWLDDATVHGGLDDLAAQLLRRRGPLGRPSGKEVGWARQWQAQRRQRASQRAHDSDHPAQALESPPVAGAARVAPKLIEVEFPDPLSGPGR